MKFCYCDESGTGNERIAVLVGIVVDASRMHLTKLDWRDLLELLSSLCKRQLSELHASNFYAGNGVWRSVDGRTRSRIITAIFEWLSERKHNIVYSALIKDRFFKSRERGEIPDELNTPWRFMGFHVVLAIQRAHQALPKNKGNTLFVFDQQEREHFAFTDLIARPPGWSDAYYGRRPADRRLNQVIDVPFFGDSREVGLLQLVDVAAFFLRRYLEIEEGLSKPKYEDEEEKVTAWVQALGARSIGRAHMYLSKGRSEAADYFYAHAPQGIHSV
jgi:hypothetical protein